MCCVVVGVGVGVSVILCCLFFTCLCCCCVVVVCCCGPCGVCCCLLLWLWFVIGTLKCARLGSQVVV